MAESTCQVHQIKGKDVVTLRVKNGDQESFVEIYAYGAHVTRWEEKGKAPFLFLSKQAVLDGTKSIRGGIPIVWPQFGPRGPLPQHGFARSCDWKIAGSETGEGKAQVTFALSANEATKKLWNHDFEMAYTVALHGAANSRLVTSWCVKNVGKEPFSFTGALHTYFTVGDITQTTVGKFDGCTYECNVDKKMHDSPSTFSFDGELDRVVIGTASRLHIHDQANHRTFVVEKTELPEAVVWNPWAEKAKAMSDFGDDEYRVMMCLEPAVIAKPVQLAPEQSWQSVQSLSVVPAENTRCSL